MLQVNDQPARPLELQVGAGVRRVGVGPALDDAEAAADAGIDVDLPRLAHAGREPLADLGRVDPRVEDILGLRPEVTADAGADGRCGRHEPPPVRVRAPARALTKTVELRQRADV